jgi:hypothetical protein
MQSHLDQPDSRALLMWSRLIQAASTIVIGLSLVLMLTPSLGESLFYLVYFQQANSPVAVPEEVQGYIRFANGIIGAVMAGWMLTIILLARGPFMTGEHYAWQAIAWPLVGWYLIDTCFSVAHGVWGNVLLNTATAVMFGIPLIGSRRLFVD